MWISSLEAVEFVMQIFKPNIYLPMFWLSRSVHLKKMMHKQKAFEYVAGGWGMEMGLFAYTPQQKSTLSTSGDSWKSHRKWWIFRVLTFIPFNSIDLRNLDIGWLNIEIRKVPIRCYQLKNSICISTLLTKKGSLYSLIQKVVHRFVKLRCSNDKRYIFLKLTSNLKT